MEKVYNFFLIIEIRNTNTYTCFGNSSDTLFIRYSNEKKKKHSLQFNINKVFIVYVNSEFIVYLNSEFIVYVEQEMIFVKNLCISGLIILIINIFFPLKFKCTLI